MSSSAPSDRKPAAPVARQFLSRWSPRAFAATPVTDEEMASLFEAARWAPSCFNDQPWLFVWGSTPEEREPIEGLLADANQAWASKAPVLGIVFARRAFARNGKPNRWGPFDAGAASMSLSLQAQELGLHTHFMGGFDESASYAALGVPEDEFTAMAAFAVGRLGDPDTLAEGVRERELERSGRKDPSEVAVRGRYRS